MFIRWSTLVRLKIVFPLFCISLVSGPAGIPGLITSVPPSSFWPQHNQRRLPPKTTRPKHHSVFLSVHPLSRILSLSRPYVCPFTIRFPLNLSRQLLGGSHWTSPATQGLHQHQHLKSGTTSRDFSPLNLARFPVTSPISPVTVRACFTFRLVSLEHNRSGRSSGRRRDTWLLFAPGLNAASYLEDIRTTHPSSSAVST